MSLSVPGITSGFAFKGAKLHEECVIPKRKLVLGMRSILR